MILMLAAAANLFSATTPNLSNAETTAEKAAMVQSVQKVASGGGGGDKGTADVMIISPAERASDIVQAFKYIQSYDVTSKVDVKLKDGSMITDILDIQMMPSGTLLIFKLQTLKGEIYRIVKIENIVEVQT